MADGRLRLRLALADCGLEWLWLIVAQHWLVVAWNGLQGWPLIAAVWLCDCRAAACVGG